MLFAPVGRQPRSLHPVSGETFTNNETVNCKNIKSASVTSVRVADVRDVNNTGREGLPVSDFDLLFCILKAFVYFDSVLNILIYSVSKN